jgi:hypothetical protein
MSTYRGSDTFELISPDELRLSQADHESIQDRIVRITNDIEDLKTFHNIELSSTRSHKLFGYLGAEQVALDSEPFDSYSQAEKVDCILLQNWLSRQVQEQGSNRGIREVMGVAFEFVDDIIKLSEDRQNVLPFDIQQAGQQVNDIGVQVDGSRTSIENGNLGIEKTIAYRVGKAIARLRTNLVEWYSFYNGYDPAFAWWLEAPFEKTNTSIAALIDAINTKLVGIAPGDTDTIIGEPSGRDRLIEELKVEMIAYSPEEIIKIGETEYAWTENEMKKAAAELGFGDDWRKALEHVKDDYVKPGTQPQLIHQLAHEAIDFVKKYDLVSVPDVAAGTWRVLMMSPDEQKVAPFFLGGSDILVAYPTNAMSHEQKMMSMRGNNRNFARSTVFHELIPGHKLQVYSLARYKPYRTRVGDTPLWMEGWAFYCTFSAC